MSKIFYLKGVRWALRAFLWCGVFGLLFIVWHHINALPGQSWKTLSYVLDHPEFYGLHKKENSYVVRGDSAAQEVTDRYGFVNPWAKLETKTQESPFFIQGERGRYDHNQKFLEIYGKVRVSSQENYLWTPYAFMDLKNRYVKGDRPVKGKGPLGEFQAQGFWMDQAKIRLKGPALMSIETH